MGLEWLCRSGIYNCDVDWAKGLFIAVVIESMSSALVTFA